MQTPPSGIIPRIGGSGVVRRRRGQGVQLWISPQVQRALRFDGMGGSPRTRAQTGEGRLRRYSPVSTTPKKKKAGRATPRKKLFPYF